MKSTKPHLHPRLRGFTLIELMVTVAILAVLLSIAVPSFRESIMNARMTGLANDIMADLNVARAEAVRRNARAYLCTSSNGTTCTGSAWNLGWIVYVDANNNGVQDSPAEPALKARPALSTGSNLLVQNDLAGGGGSRQVLYRPSGASNVGGAVVSFILCDARNTAAVGVERAENRGRLIQVETTGRPLVTRRTCGTATT